MRKLNKKGDLLNNVLTTFIAVLGLVLIAYAAYAIYTSVSNQAVESAKKTISFVEDKINALENGKSEKIDFIGLEEWSIVGWSKDETGRPDKCYFKSCLCICKGIGGGTKNEKLGLVGSSALDACRGSNGICRLFDANEILISAPPSHDYIKVGDIIDLPSNIIEIEISKDADGAIGVKYTR